MQLRNWGVDQIRRTVFEWLLKTANSKQKSSSVTLVPNVILLVLKHLLDISLNEV